MANTPIKVRTKRRPNSRNSNAPRERTRNTIHHDPQYYKIRNHLVDFLVNRSKEYRPRDAGVQPPTVKPGLETEDKPRPTLTRAA